MAERDGDAAFLAMERLTGAARNPRSAPRAGSRSFVTGLPAKTRPSDRGRLSGEHARRFAVLGYTIALETTSVRGERCRPQPVVTYDARFHDDASGQIERPGMRQRTAGAQLRP
jgi:hypothetical protein